MPPFLWPVTPLLDQHNDSRWWNENKQKQVGDARPERDILVSIKHKVGNEMKTIFILWLNGLRTGGANQGRRERAQSVGGRRCRGMAEGIYKEGGIQRSRRGWCFISKTKAAWGFPGGPVVKTPPANAETRVWSLVWEDPTCHEATKPLYHNYWAHALEPGSWNCWSLHAREATAMRSSYTTREAPAHYS